MNRVDKGKHSKIKINKNIRLVLIILNLVAILAGVILIYSSVTTKKVVERKENLFSLSNNGSINYSVFLKPNIIYADKSLGEGSTYINDLIDYINTTFRYDFKGDTASKIQGEYEIVSVVEGSLADEKDSNNMWQKEFVIQPKTSFEANNSSFKIEKILPINIASYNKYASDVAKACNVNFQTKAKIYFKVNLNITTDSGIIKENLNPYMEIPLGAKTFKISGNLKQDKPQNISKTIKNVLPINRTNIVFEGITSGIFMIFLIIILTCTDIKPEESVMDKKLKKISKLYGNRLVSIDEDLGVEDKNCIKVSSIQDIVRISDDISKPILYLKRSEEDLKARFYVTEDDKIYMYELVNRNKMNFHITEEGDSTCSDNYLMNQMK